MIELARRQEAEHGLGIEYQVGDAKNLGLGPNYDLVVAAYLLNYASDRAELAAMCRGIASSLKPGGRFMTVNCNPALDFRRAPSYRPLWFRDPHDGRLSRGRANHLDLSPRRRAVLDRELLPRRPPSRSRLPRRRLQRHSLAPSTPLPQGEQEFGAPFWRPFLDHPPATFIECVK
jgi:hypothetical protein